MTEPVLRADSLRVALASGAPIVEDVTLSVAPGEVLGLVGESGSGKTTTALALLGYCRPGVRFAGGSITVAGKKLTSLGERERRRLRGRLISYVPQEPATALNPSVRVGDQIRTMLGVHAPDRPQEDVDRVLAKVRLPSDHEFRRRFPHQLSGGQQQRIAIAVALVCRPPVVVLDEPTTGLDVVVQAELLDEIRRLRDEIGLAMVYVSHDLAVVASIADRIAVMYAGRVVEEAPTQEIVRHPRHPYTRGLIAAVPDHAAARRLQGMGGTAPAVGERPPGCAFAERCPQRLEACTIRMPALEAVAPAHAVRCFEWRRTPALEDGDPFVRPGGRDGAAPLLEVVDLHASHRSRGTSVVAADRVSFIVGRGECVALVGESGSGKTTIARCIAGLHRPDSGRILLDGVALAGRASRRPLEARRRIQIVFQNPYDSLNPLHSVGSAVARPARALRGLGRRDAEQEVRRLLALVRLPRRTLERYPPELSGGERQRVAIARALAAEPDLLVCDEITSALDVSVQAAVLELLAELRERVSLSMLFISHDLGVVASVSDRVLILREGAICEEGPVEALRQPRHEYTRRLVSAAPRLAVS